MHIKVLWLLLLLLFPQSSADLLGSYVFDDNMDGLWCDLNGVYGWVRGKYDYIANKSTNLLKDDPSYCLVT